MDKQECFSTRKNSFDLSQLYTFSVAPMVDVSNTYFRTFMRLITKNATLFTEMIHCSSILNEETRQYNLKFNIAEQPVVLQIGGCNPDDLAKASIIGEQYGYQEINLNCGCPSPKVQCGSFGACLMKEPELVGQCLKAMRESVKIPVSVKCRLGVDEFDSYEFFESFVQKVYEISKVDIVYVHARKAYLKGLNPKENRNIPPLRYEWVFQIKKKYPNIIFVLNGGIKTVQQSQELLKEGVDGIMIGRGVWHDPFHFSNLDSKLYNKQDQNFSRKEILEKYAKFLDNEDNQSLSMIYKLKPILSLFNGIRGNKIFKQYFSNKKNMDKFETVEKLMQDFFNVFESINKKGLEEKPNQFFNFQIQNLKWKRIKCIVNIFQNKKTNWIKQQKRINKNYNKNKKLWKYIKKLKIAEILEHEFQKMQLEQKQHIFNENYEQKQQKEQKLRKERIKKFDKTIKVHQKRVVQADKQINKKAMDQWRNTIQSKENENPKKTQRENNKNKNETNNSSEQQKKTQLKDYDKFVREYLQNFENNENLIQSRLETINNTKKEQLQKFIDKVENQVANQQKVDELNQDKLADQYIKKFLNQKEPKKVVKTKTKGQENQPNQQETTDYQKQQKRNMRDLKRQQRQEKKELQEKLDKKFQNVEQRVLTQCQDKKDKVQKFLKTWQNVLSSNHEDQLSKVKSNQKKLNEFYQTREKVNKKNFIKQTMMEQQREAVMQFRLQQQQIQNDLQKFLNNKAQKGQIIDKIKQDGIKCKKLQDILDKIEEHEQIEREKKLKEKLEKEKKEENFQFKFKYQQLNNERKQNCLAVI